MPRRIFIGSTIACLLFTGLSRMSDPSVLGIAGTDEPMRILFYGGSGLLAALSGLIAVGSGIYLGATRFAGLSEGQRYLMLAVMWVVLMTVLITLVLRVLPR